MVDNNQQPSINRWHKAGQISKVVLAGGSILILSILTLLSVSTTLAGPYDDTTLSADNIVISTMSPTCDTSSLVLAEYQAWHGLSSHLHPPPYTSTDSAVITRHILEAKAKCIDGFVVNWYGPPDGMPNDEDRDFIDQAFAELLRQAKIYDFKAAIVYDEGTLRGAAPLTTTRTISDLIYATKYFTSSSYLKINGHPSLFVFPYENIDPDIDWQTVRQELTSTVTLIDKDPNPSDPTHDALFDGFYAWVQPAGAWKPDGTEWGKEYLRWFYNTMASPLYSNKVAIGGVWPGFDDTLASWGSGRYMWRRCGQTWYDTWDIADEFNPPIVMIGTWNDFEEGTDIEYDTGACLAPPKSQYTGPRAEVVYTHTLTNTGKLTDTFNLTALSSRGWPTSINLSSVMLSGYNSIPVAITLTVPQDTSSCGQDLMVITATSTLSTAVKNSVMDTTTVPCIYLPIIFTPPWQDNFNPIRNTWIPISAIWNDVSGPTAILRENNPNTFFGKVESEIITLNMDTYPILRVKVTNVDPSSSYTIQIDDTDVLKGITSHGEHTINIADKMGWQGVHSFTISIWISGEGKSSTFDFIGFEAN